MTPEKGVKWDKCTHINEVSGGRKHDFQWGQENLTYIFELSGVPSYDSKKKKGGSNFDPKKNPKGIPFGVFWGRTNNFGVGA